MAMLEGGSQPEPAVPRSGADDDQARRDSFTSRLDASKRTTVDASEFTADHHFVAFGQQISDHDLVTWEGGFDLAYVLD